MFRAAYTAVRVPTMICQGENLSAKHWIRGVCSDDKQQEISRTKSLVELPNPKYTRTLRVSSGEPPYPKENDDKHLHAVPLITEVRVSSITPREGTDLCTFPGWAWSPKNMIYHRSVLLQGNNRAHNSSLLQLFNQGDSHVIVTHY